MTFKELVRQLKRVCDAHLQGRISRKRLFACFEAAERNCTVPRLLDVVFTRTSLVGPMRRRLWIEYRWSRAS